jgi:Polyketide cyclase / dehydrase and lipid transport
VKIRVCTTIAVTPDDLWRRLEHIEDHVEWMADARAITFVGHRRRGVGTEFDCLTAIGPLRTTDRMVVTEWEPRRSMGIEHRGVVTGRGRFTLRRRRGGRTRFCWEERLQFPWWMGGPVGALLAKPVLRRVWRRNLARLAQLATAGHAE